MEEPRLDLVSRLREEIERDPEGFVERRLAEVVERILMDPDVNL